MQLTLTAKPLALRGLDRGDGFVEAAFHADRFVVMFLDAVEMHGEEQIGRRREQMQLLFQKQRIGAQRHEFLARDDAATISPISLWISGSPPGMATIGAPHSSTASRHSCTGQPLVEDRIGIIDLAAAGAGEIAAEQRFQHQHERIARAPSQTLAQHIGADLGFLSQRYTQDSNPL